MEENHTHAKEKAILMAVVIIVVLGAVIFLPAGSFGYWQGWMVWTLYSVSMLFTAFFLLMKDPHLLSRRMDLKQDMTPRKPPAILNLCFLCYIIPGLDYRFHWSLVPVWLVVLAAVVMSCGYLLIILVFKENSYASAKIRLEKGQHVITTGPYALIRHPMYLGIVLMILFTPLALGSYWAMIPALLCIPLNVIRIQGEEEVLSKGLSGYDEYCRRIRYRLIPYLW
jgi:protein-S-isoprenylcysteine O-methyltransferase Ste14